MAENLDEFRKIVEELRRYVNAPNEQGNFLVEETGGFAHCLCGADGLLSRVVSTMLRAPGGELPGSWETTEPGRTLLACLDNLDNLIHGRRMSKVYQQDATIPGRWTALSRLVRAKLVGDSSDAFGEHLQAARESFDRIWRKEGLAATSDVPTLADSLPAKAQDKGEFAKVNQHLQPWSAASWMVWDVLGQWNGMARPVAVETARVLFGRGRGQVMRLDVEALPGPPGLVTPHWWKLGLGAFPTANPDRFLLLAIQKLMRRAAAGVGMRLRWHLHAAGRDPWQVGLDGRSVEASVAVAVLALRERLEAGRSEIGETTECVLDDHAAVTGVVRAEGPNAHDWPIEHVGKDTLPAKFRAADEAQIDVICIPDRQPRDGVAVPERIRVEEVSSVGEALELLRAENRAFDRYRQFVRGQFAYHEE